MSQSKTAKNGDLLHESQGANLPCEEVKVCESSMIETRRSRETEQIKKLPSPAPSHSLGQILGQKRKQPDTCASRDDNSSSKKLKLSELQYKPTSVCEDHSNPLDHWRNTGYWPPGFTKRGSEMNNPRDASNNSNKTLQTSSYFQSVKDGEVHAQWTAEYEKWIFTKGLDMDLLRGEERVSKESKRTCNSLQKITRKIINPSLFPQGAIRKVINLCCNRNEAIVNRDVTPMIIPPITSLYFGGDNRVEHVVDEVRTDWYNNLVLEGPRLRPNLAIGLLSSAFTSAETDKLSSYKAVDNWARFTEDMYFPFLMCEVKSGKEDLDRADRQNMHSSSVAVRALLRLEQEADKYRSDKRLAHLSGQILVFSILHDQQDARLYGHYALIRGENWIYYRYPIKRFHILTSAKDTLSIYNFVQNILESHLPEHLKRLRDALAALPHPTTVSIPTSEMASQDSSQQGSQDQNAARPQESRQFLKPAPRSAGESVNTELQSMVRSLESQLEQQRREFQSMVHSLQSQLELQRKDAEQQRKDLMALFRS